MNIVLTGFMGSGKTVVGKTLARKLNRRFLDTDAMIEAQVKTSIKEFFKKFGESGFRLVERETVKRASRYKDVVISCGGGVVLTPLNIKFLRRKGIIVNLYASPKEIYARIKGDSSRPLLNCPNPVAKIKELLAKREELYADCDYSFKTDGLSADEAAEKILDTISDKI
jgi:shikimate kinase